MASSRRSLLGVNSGVENLILSFVSSGEGGLKNILNLRLVCSTTKEWIDKLPKRVADVVFLRAQVKVNIDFDTFNKFLFYPPPFEVTALSLGREMCAVEDESDASDTCDRFCEFWSSKLESLELRHEIDTEYPFDHFRMQLMESLNLRTLKFRGDLGLQEDTISVPSCFQKVRELHAGSIWLPEDRLRDQFFTQLHNNDNLEVISVELTCGQDLIDFSNLIDHKKEDTQLQITFTLKLDFECSRKLFRKFAVSILASKCKIRLKVDDMGHFKKHMEKYLQRLPRTVCLEVFKTVESAESWKPTEASLSLLENFPRLRKLYSLDMGDTSLNSDIDRLTFPCVLEELEFIRGFPPCGNLPRSLTSLRLCAPKCHIYSLLGFMKLLRSQCPHLNSLFICKWKSTVAERGSYVNLGYGSGFSSLRKFTFAGELLKTDRVGDFRRVIANIFNWRDLQLHSLSLLFTDSDGRRLPLVNGEILRHLYEGPSAKSIEEFEIPNDCVASENLPRLQAWRSLATANLNKRIKTKMMM